MSESSGLGRAIIKPRKMLHGAMTSVLHDLSLFALPTNEEADFQRFLNTEFTSQNLTLSKKEHLVMQVMFKALNPFLTSRQMKEVLSGAHVILRSDSGELYHKLSRNDAEGFDAYERNSSHHSKDQTFGIVLGKVLRTILTGTTVDGDTWFQMEGAPWGKLATYTDCFEHAIDYVKYKLTGFNQGPLGRSLYTEAAPLIVDIGI